MSLSIYDKICMGINYLVSCAYQEKTDYTDLDEMNHLWLSAYAARKTKTKNSLGAKEPVILLNGDDLILRYNGKREIHRYVPKEYHQLKSIAHISCLIHTILMLQQGNTAPIEATQKEKEAQSMLESIQLPISLKKYRPLIEKYKKLLEKKDISKLSKIRGTLDELIDAAAKCRLASLHQITESIREKIPEEDWQKLVVIVMGPQMPRNGDLGMQYYHSILDVNKQKLKCPYRMQLDQNLSQQRLIYAESIYDEEGALDLLTTHICDEDLGKDLLGNKRAMHSDILKNATAKHLKTLK